MIILNLHGYKGSSKNAAYSALKELGHEVISPQIDYDSFDADKIFSVIIDFYIESKPDIIVGTSFGGFFACLLSARSNIPAIVVNPCLSPFEILPKLGYTQDVTKFFDLTVHHFRRLKNENISAIVGGKDEVIGSHALTKSLLYNERYKVIPEGKHSGATLPLKEYFAECISDYGYRLKKVLIYSRKEIENIIANEEFPDNAAVISFCNPPSEYSDSHVEYRDVCNNVFYVELEDLDIDELAEKGYTYETFFPKADKLAKFIDRAVRFKKQIICQCEYGQSRSAGCAAAILEYYYHNGISVFTDYKRYPNKVVYHKVYDALNNMT